MIFRRKDEQSLDNEIRDYMDRETQLNVEGGMPEEEARLAARRKLGSPSYVKEETRAVWGWTWIERLWQDLEYSGRTMAKNPGFTLVAILSLAIGIGANSAMFSLADALVLRPLPVPHPSGVVSVGFKNSVGGFGNVNASYREYIDIRDRSKSFEGLMAYSINAVGFAAHPGETPHMRMGMLVSGNFFRVLDVEPELGRAFRDDEDQVPGRDAVVILSHDLWEHQLAADPAILGRKVHLSGIEFTVIGVAPAHFTGLDPYFRPEFFVPVAMWPRFVNDPKEKPLEARDYRNLSIRGRLKPGVTMSQAQAELTSISTALEQAYPATNHNQKAFVLSELQRRIEQSPPDAELAAMLIVLAGGVLLVACANVAGLLLSRVPVRSREMALRLAIGAGRPRLIRQLLTESFLMALAGGVAGLAVGYASVSFLQKLQPPTDLPVAVSVTIDQRALVFSLAVSLLSAILFGLAPAFQTTRADLIGALRTAGEDTPRKHRLLGRNALVVAQVALSLVLLMVATFVYRGFRVMIGEGPGFRTDHILMMTFDPGLVRYDQARTQQFFRRVEDQARSLAGVRSAALASAIPMNPTGLDTANILPEGYQFPKGVENASLFSCTVDENYFDTMDIQIVRGRGIRFSDTSTAPRVAVVNEELAKHYWPGRDPIGRRFRLDTRESPWVEIVGVAKTTKYLWIAEAPQDYIYFPLAQHPQRQMTLLTLTAGNPNALAEPIRQMVRAMDSSQPVFDVRSFEDFYQYRAVGQPNVIIRTIAAMGVLGLVLGLIGLYGLVAYSASRRRREIGIRMAIGAARGTVLRMVLRQGLILALSGIGVGLLASFGAERALNAMFSSHGTDFVTYILVIPGLLAVTAAAAYIPARRASRIEPMRVLRYE